MKSIGGNKMKYLRFCLAAVLAITVLLSACGIQQDTSESEPSTSENVNVSNDLSALPDLPYVQAVTVPYKKALDPVLVDNILYMAVAEADRTETDTNRLVAYNIETGEETLLFTSTQEYAYMQLLQTDGEWLVWMDLHLYGGECNIYMMRLETREITQVSHFSSEAPSYTSPVYMDGKIYWIEEENVIGSEDNLTIAGHVYEYDCNTKQKSAVAEMQNIFTNNLDLAAKDGKVVWFERVGDAGNYYIYDAASGKTDVIASKQPDAMNIQYSDGCIFAFETENYNEQTSKQMVCIDIKTGAYTELVQNFINFRVTDNYLFGTTGSVVWFYERNKNNEPVVIPEIACSDFSSYNSGQGDTVFIVEQNDGISETPYQGLKNETTIRIYKLGERAAA